MRKKIFHQKNYGGISFSNLKVKRILFFSHISYGKVNDQNNMFTKK